MTKSENEIGAIGFKQAPRDLHDRDDSSVDLREWDWIVISSSGGKDSQAMLSSLVAEGDRQGVERSRFVVVHADLGRVEWRGTRDLAREHAESLGLRFEVVSRPQGDLLDHVRSRGLWPSSKQRYCTSDHKRGQIAKLLTQLAKESESKRPRILSCLGLRAEESPARAKKVALSLDNRNTNGRREVWTYLPILDWTVDEVWSEIRRSGLRHHDAYDLGMSRLSCCFCIFASRSDLETSARANPELLQEYVSLEKEIGHRFRADLSLAVLTQ